MYNEYDSVNYDTLDYLEDEKNTLSYVINDSGKLEWVENKGNISADEVLSQNNSFNDKTSNAKGFIIGALARGDIGANDLKELVMKKGNITEKTYNISKACLHKEGIINSYQENRQFYWSLNNASDSVNGKVVNSKNENIIN